jgi:N-acetylglucosamine-6-phosphate deacetylase
MKIVGGQVLSGDWRFRPLDISIAGDRIVALNPRAGNGGVDGTMIDAGGCLVIPGLVDIHIHGCVGQDFSDADPAGMEEMADYLASQGVTSFLGTTMALSEASMIRALAMGRSIMTGDGSALHDAPASLPAAPRAAAVMRGMYLEGPFLSLAKKGAQAAEFIRDPDPPLFRRLAQAGGPALRLIAIAPERPGALELIRSASAHATVALAHTNAQYDQAAAAFKAGATHVTHMFNAMPPFSHRDPGVIGAASDAGATVELICDGVHLHSSVVRAAFRWFGADKVVLVSDAMRACGLPDGSYTLGGQTVSVKGNRAALADGTLAGSVLNLMQCLRQAVAFGVPLASAVRAATGNPAVVARVFDRTGSLEVGKQADLLLVTPNLEIKDVILGGRLVARRSFKKRLNDG